MPKKNKSIPRKDNKPSLKNTKKKSTKHSQSRSSKPSKAFPRKNKSSRNGGDILEGVIQGHINGFGFFIPDSSYNADDIYVSSDEMYKVIHKDRVVLKRFQSKRSDANGAPRYRGVIVDLLERKHRKILGTLVRKGSRWYLSPKDQRYATEFIISTREENISDAFDINVVTLDQEGMWVIAEILNEGLLHSAPAVKILNQLSDNLENLPFTEQALIENDVPHVFTNELLDSIDHDALELSPSDYSSRHDLRKLPFVTIDGDSSKDFDDAVFVKSTDKGYTLYVAIADVAHYIKPNSLVDEEAEVRGNSIYFPDRVVPMLPEVYSNQWCSLNPLVDRLTMVCEMEIDNNGQCMRYSFYDAVIHSHQRLTYNQVQSYLDSNDPKELSSKDIRDSLDTSFELYKKLRGLRTKRGALDFNLPSCELKLNDNGKLDKVDLITRQDSHCLIEEFMLSANVCAGTFLNEHTTAAIYRSHEKPEDKKLAVLQEYLKTLGISLFSNLGDSENIEPKHLMRVLSDNQLDTTKQTVVQYMMLRAQQQARYDSEPNPHFALDYPLYSHFTSPIRRYSDLIAHRLIKSIINEKPISKRLYKSLVNIAEHCSKTERVAESMGRDVENKIKLDYLQEFVGHEFDGVITGVHAYGMFVEIGEYLVSGLVSTDSLPGDYYYIEESSEYFSSKKKCSLSLGQSVKTKIALVDVRENRLDLVLVN